MVCAVYKRVWKNDDLQEFGTIGQRQHGVDVFGHIEETRALGGLQCKCVEKFKPSELELEYRDALNFEPKLAKYLVVTTTKKDTALQLKSAELTMTYGLRCAVVFWEDFATQLSRHRDLLKTFYSDFMLFEVEGDAPGKYISVEIGWSHFEIVISELRTQDDHYSGSLLVSDLQNARCSTFRLGDHWSRLEGVVGVGRADSFAITKWLNSFKNVQQLLNVGRTQLAYELSQEDRDEAEDLGIAVR